MGAWALYFASSNLGKLREFRQAATPRGILVETLPRFEELTVCIEDGATFQENACKKAVHYSRNFEGLVFADDSGLSVDALGGAPGVHSARYAGPDARDEQNNELLLEELHRVEAERRAQAVTAARPRALFNRVAHYDCAIALAQLGQVLTVAEGRAEGVIIDEPRGVGGFGYDPYFFYPPLGKTFAAISPEEKFAVSHRGAAFRKLLDYLCRGGQ
ncbi:MAG: non-canonical purine NTP pyrophosphatase [Terriglobia bacterium]|jgi:XTP/dITP diphosphohydrolase